VESRRWLGAGGQAADSGASTSRTRTDRRGARGEKGDAHEIMRFSWSHLKKSIKSWAFPSSHMWQCCEPLIVQEIGGARRLNINMLRMLPASPQFREVVVRYLIVDACLHGTGIRDEYEGGYIKPSDMDLSAELMAQLENWLLAYEDEHYSGYDDPIIIDELDTKGRNLAHQIEAELGDVKVSYYSDAKLTFELELFWGRKGHGDRP
jgi:hypothetical protein